MTPARLAALAVPALVLAALSATVACGDAADDPGSTTPDAGARADASEGEGDAGSNNAPADATAEAEPAPRIRDLPAPDCHTAEQKGELVTPTAAAGAAPAPGAVTITPGTYVVVAVTDYGGAAVVSMPARTSAVFTSTKQYYRSETPGGDVTAVTSTWRVVGTALVRDASCPEPGVVRYELAPAANGFEMLVPAAAGRTTGVRYQRL